MAKTEQILRDTARNLKDLADEDVLGAASLAHLTQLTRALTTAHAMAFEELKRRYTSTINAVQGEQS